MLETKIHDKESAPTKSQEGLAKAEEKYGFIPNFVGLIAESPSVLTAYAQLGSLFEETEFNEQERQVIYLAASVTNECHYCVPAHISAAKKADFTQEQIQALRLNQALSDSKLECLRQFTSEIVRNRGTVSNETLKTFLDEGYTRKHAMELVLGVSQKTLSNTINHLFQTPVDEALKEKI